MNWAIKSVSNIFSSPKRHNSSCLIFTILSRTDLEVASMVIAAVAVNQKNGKVDEVKVRDDIFESLPTREKKKEEEQVRVNEVQC